MLNINRISILLFTSFLTMGCSNKNDAFMPSKKQTETFLQKNNLDDTYLLNEELFENPIMITDYSPIVDKNPTIIKSKEEFLNYEPEIYKQDNYYEEFNYKEFKNISLEKFDDYNLVISSDLMSGYAAFDYIFKNLFLKNNKLIFHYYYDNYLPEGVAVNCVCGNTAYLTFIKKTVEFTEIQEIIEKATDYTDN
ncbi:MAG: hypothetical protein J6Y28_00440 [Acholeplasmatales bacterium]|nr:hypothetical protein [Acholeplasmatales bacterium]